MKKNIINIAVVGGIRPQLIKIAAFNHNILRFNEISPILINSININTRQHYDKALSESLIAEFKLKFDYSLQYNDLDPINMLGSMIPQLYEVFSNISKKISLDWVVVFGDATTTMAAAIAANRRGLKVLHIEAGVRSGDLTSLEEIHRRVVSHISVSYTHLAKVPQPGTNICYEIMQWNISIA